MNFAALGAIAGTGQGIQQGVGTLVARRREERELRRQQEKDEREERRIELAEKRLQDANRRALMSEDMDFIIKGGRIIRNNGTEHIGATVGKSTASTQPSEYDVEYETVGSYDGATYQLPKDRLTPAERLKQRGRTSRASAASNLPFYKPNQAEIDLLDDAEQGDQILQGMITENRMRDPASIDARARSAGAIAGARYPYSATANKSENGGGETPAQRKAAMRTFASGESSNETAARQDMNAAKPLEKKDYGWVSPQAGFMTPEDSLRYERDNTAQFGTRQRARLRATEHGYSADSTRKEIVKPQSGAEALAAKFDAIKEAYAEALAEAKTPAERAEAKRLFQGAIDRAAREYESSGGKLNRGKAQGGGGSSF
jgi:hypothetical protein